MLLRNSCLALLLGLLATPLMEVSSVPIPVPNVGTATLELTGERAGVFANVHNYGRSGYGDLLINGVAQDGSQRLPNYHLRPYFDEE